MFKNLTNLASAMKNLTQLGPQMQAINARLESARVYGSSMQSGLSVNVEMNGLGIVQSVSIAPALCTEENRALLERMTTEAMNDAIRSAKELHIKAIKDLTGGAELFPGMNDMLENMTK
jgi:nucleoid-associated protein EbfC